VKRSDFYYPLPESLIAQYPLTPRSRSGLLRLDRQTGEVDHFIFSQLPALLQPNDLLVLNNTKVIPARLYGYKETKGRVEVLVERIQDNHQALAHLGASRPPHPDQVLYINQMQRLRVCQRQGELFLIESLDQPIRQLLYQHGVMPLPPYIKRPENHSDHSYYQTCYAEREGAVAAPTAGLHFDKTVFDQLDAMGVQRAYLTLHVGAGTFQPVKTEDIHHHVMHQEYMEVDEMLCQKVRETKASGGRVIAVGTTCVRALETAADKVGTVKPYDGETDIFIYPGYSFQVIDGMITNFHLPESTLIMLVAAFGGYNHVMNAYHQAVKRQYRFYSYGDAMFII